MVGIASEGMGSVGMGSVRVCISAESFIRLRGDPAESQELIMFRCFAAWSVSCCRIWNTSVA